MTKGHWVDASGEHIIEKMIPVRIACTEAEIVRIADLTCQHYDQDVVMYYKVSDNVVFRGRNEAKPK
jgi:hypothetical protein